MKLKTGKINVKEVFLSSNGLVRAWDEDKNEEITSITASVFSLYARYVLEKQGIDPSGVVFNIYGERWECHPLKKKGEYVFYYVED